LGEECRSLSLSLCSFLHSPVTLSLIGPNILLNTLSLHSSLNVSDQVSHPYKTTGKIIVLYLLIFKFLDSKPVNVYFTYPYPAYFLSYMHLSCRHFHLCCIVGRCVINCMPLQLCGHDIGNTAYIQ